MSYYTKIQNKVEELAVSSRRLTCVQLRLAIEKALQEAIESERESCAQVADNFCEKYPPSKGVGKFKIQSFIATSIRQRK
jgi:hypothetical protein